MYIYNGYILLMNSFILLIYNGYILLMNSPFCHYIITFFVSCYNLCFKSVLSSISGYNTPAPFWLLLPRILFSIPSLSAYMCL